MGLCEEYGKTSVYGRSPFSDEAVYLTQLGWVLRHREDSSPARIYSTKQICCPDLLVPRGSQSVLGVPYLASASAENSPVVFVDVVDPTLGALWLWMVVVVEVLVSYFLSRQTIKVL